MYFYLLPLLLPFIIFFVAHYWRPGTVARVEVSKRLRHILERCAILNDAYRPPLWGYNGHLQTAWCLLGRRSPVVAFERHVLAVPATDAHPHGGVISVDTAEPSTLDADALSRQPMIVIVPGVVGSSKQHYVRSFALACLERNYRICILNHRGCGDTDLATPHIFTFGDWHDLDFAVKYAVKRMKRALGGDNVGAGDLPPIFTVGFSMGGNILCNYLARAPTRPPTLRAAVSICQGYDAEKGAEAINAFYGGVLLRKMQSLVRSHHERIAPHLDDIERVYKARTIYEFEEAYTLKVHSTREWRSAAHYYSDMSCAPHLQRIETPLLLLNALDDPMVPGEFVPYGISERNENIALVSVPYGGHLGFANGTLWTRRDTWMDELTLEWIDANLRNR